MNESPMDHHQQIRAVFLHKDIHPRENPHLEGGPILPMNAPPLPMNPCEGMSCRTSGISEGGRPPEISEKQRCQDVPNCHKKDVPHSLPIKDPIVTALGRNKEPDSRNLQKGTTKNVSQKGLNPQSAVFHTRMKPPSLNYRGPIKESHTF